MKKLPKNSGQALLVILLIMAVALTIGLAVTSRTVTDIEISEQTEEAARAFSAAEAGIEEALVTAEWGELPPGDLGEGVTYTTRKDPLGAGTEYVFPKASSPDEIYTLWLAEHDNLENKVFDRELLPVLWGNPGTTPALEVSIYYESAGEYKVHRFPLDPEGGRDNSFCKANGDNCEYVRCGGIKGFCTGGETLNGTTFQYKANLRLGSPGAGIAAPGNKLLFARFRFLYTDEVQSLGAMAAGDILSGDGNFPSQGVKISSVGTTNGSTRKVEVVRLHPAPPGIFDFLLYSETDLNK